MYIRTYMSVTLRNVNLQYRLECQFEVTPRQDIGYHMHYTTTLGRRFLATKDGEDSVAGPSQRTYLAKSSTKVSGEHSDG